MAEEELENKSSSYSGYSSSRLNSIENTLLDKGVRNNYPAPGLGTKYLPCILKNIPIQNETRLSLPNG
jgi:hypothetical protein